MIKKIIILGSTGSIGCNTLEVIRQNRDKFKVVGLTAGGNTSLLNEQIREFRPNIVAIFDEKKRFTPSKKSKVLRGLSGINELVKITSADLVVVGVSGAGVIFPLLSAIRTKKDIAIANKETLVMAGHIIMEEAKKAKINIIPVDSEQSAIFQCLNSDSIKQLKKIYLTASGGPFCKFNKNKLVNISINQALLHPRWKMGKKISVDSATLMNKGLEVIEAMFLFGVNPKNIKVIIHPEVVIHSMVEFVDGVILAQLSSADMKFPIGYALNYPSRLKTDFKPLDFFKIKSLNFLRPDFDKFPCLRLAYQVAFKGNSFPAVLNGANEQLVNEFLCRRIKFIDIPRILEKVLSRHHQKNSPNLTEVLAIDSWARQEVLNNL